MRSVRQVKPNPRSILPTRRQQISRISYFITSQAINILNNSHTIQVNYDTGSYIEIDGVRYDLLQFHLHAPSEHSVNGILAEAELHLVHKNADGKLAVVGLLITAGAENPAFTTTWANLPATTSPVQTVSGQVNAAEMLPASQETYRYDGSLTTPPCSEGVKWSVMVEPIEMSEAQLAAFTSIFDGNNRPVQSLAGRTLMEDNTP